MKTVSVASCAHVGVFAPVNVSVCALLLTVDSVSAWLLPMLNPFGGGPSISWTVTDDQRLTVAQCQVTVTATESIDAGWAPIAGWAPYPSGPMRPTTPEDGPVN